MTPPSESLFDCHGGNSALARCNKKPVDMSIRRVEIKAAMFVCLYKRQGALVWLLIAAAFVGEARESDADRFNNLLIAA